MADGRGDLLASQTLGELKFFAGDRQRFLSRNVRKSRYLRTDSYFCSVVCTFVRSCNVALWGISLYLVEWRTCAVIRLHDRHALAPHLRFHSHWDGSPIMWPWYYLQRLINARVKFPPSLHLKLSHRERFGELVQDPRMQTAMWKGPIIQHLETYTWFPGTYCALPWFNLVIGLHTDAQRMLPLFRLKEAFRSASVTKM